jgi:hypothetical protein
MCMYTVYCTQQVTLKVRIDPSLGDELSNLTKIKMNMLKDLHGTSVFDEFNTTQFTQVLKSVYVLCGFL